MHSRLPGLGLFLPVPLVLWLFTQSPLGVWGSLGLGAVLTVTHRFYARPFVRRRALARCLWCAGPAGAGPILHIDEPAGTTDWRACGVAHLGQLRRFFHWTGRHAAFLRLGILGTLGVFLAAAPLADGGRLGLLNQADAVAFFRTGVALTVLPLGWLALRSDPRPPEALRAPFPVHVPALIGAGAVTWLFRLVGLVWLGLGLDHVLVRAGLI